MEDKKENEYTITNENIKFPTFVDKSLVQNFTKEKITKETLFQDISNIIENLDIVFCIILPLFQKSLKN